METDRKYNETNGNYRLTAMFSDRESTEQAYNSLKAAGYTDDDINIIMSDETRKKYYSDDKSDLGTKAAEGAGTGSAIGGTIGAIVGVIAALGTSIVLPGLGLIVAGPLVAGLAGAGAGSIAGGLIGALVGWGIPEDRAKIYETGINEGHVVLGVNPRTMEDANYLENNWRTNNGKEIYR